MNVAYFEGFNTDRSCLNMLISSMDLSAYTHVHLSFAVITSDFEIDVSSMQDQFDAFLSMTGFKHIVTIGGWTFSTDPSTYFLFREAVAPANVNTFVSNIVLFIEQNGLDGIDIDWECRKNPRLQL